MLTRDEIDTKLIPLDGTVMVRPVFSEGVGYGMEIDSYEHPLRVGWRHPTYRICRGISTSYVKDNVQKS